MRSTPSFLRRRPIRTSTAEDGEVIFFRVALEPSRLAVRHRIDGIASIIEHRLHLAGDASVVFDEQDAHQCSSRLRIADAAST